MTDESKQEAPSGPLFVALDLYDRIPRIRTACAALGVPLASVDLKDSGRAEVGFGTTEGPHGEHDHRGHASIEANAYQVRLSIEAIYRRDKPAPLGAAVAQLRASVAALDILLEPPGEVVDADPAPSCPKCKLDAEVDAAASACCRAIDAEQWDEARRLHRELEDRFGDHPQIVRLGAFIFSEAAAAEDLAGDRIAGPFWRDRERTLEAMHKAAETEVDSLKASLRQRDHVFGHLAFVAAELGVTTGENPTAEEVGKRALAKAKELRGALAGAREGRDASWNALMDLAKRTGVVFDGGESAAAIADHIFAASARGREQRDIDDLLGRLADVRKALDLDEDCFHGAVMQRLHEVVAVAHRVRDELGFADLEGLADSAVSVLARFPTVCKQYDELAAAIGCGANPDHGTAVRKAEQLQRDLDAMAADRAAIAEAAGESGACLASHVARLRREHAEMYAAHQTALADLEATRADLGTTTARLGAEVTALQRLRMALFMPKEALPDAIVELALERLGARGNAGAAWSAAPAVLRWTLGALSCPEDHVSAFIDAAVQAARIDQRDEVRQMLEQVHPLRRALGVEKDRKALVDRMEAALAKLEDLSAVMERTRQSAQVIKSHFAATSLTVTSLQGLTERNGLPVSAHNPLPVTIGDVRTSIVGAFSESSSDKAGTIVVYPAISAPDGAPVLVAE